MASVAEHPNAAGKKKLEEFRRKRAEQQASAAAARAPPPGPSGGALPTGFQLPQGGAAPLGQERGPGLSAAPAPPPVLAAGAAGSAPAGMSTHGSEALLPGDAPPPDGAGGSLNHIQLLEDELRKEALAAARARASFIQEQQKAASLSAEVARAHAERGLWEKQKAELVEQVGRLGEQLQRAEGAVSEGGALAELRKALEAARIRCDAAVVAKEDAMAQLRVVRKQLAEAEEEQYRAEEDAAALRAEIRALRHSQEAAAASSHAEELRSAEGERDAARAEAQEALLQLEAERQRRAAERQRAAAAQEEREALAGEVGRAEQRAQLAARVRDELAAQLAAARAALEQLQGQAPAESQPDAQVAAGGQQELMPPSAAPVVEVATAPEAPTETGDAEPQQGEGREGGAPGGDPAEPDAIPPGGELETLRADLEQKSAEIARLLALVEKKEKGRHRLLAEVDEQSAEIERLFTENAGLAAGLKEASFIASQWEAQLKDALQQNAELRASMARMREDAVSRSRSFLEASAGASGGGGRENGHADVPDSLHAEQLHLQVQLAEAQTRAEELEGQVAELTAAHTEALRQLSSLRSLYKPVLADIENRLGSLRTEQFRNGSQ